MELENLPRWRVRPPFGPDRHILIQVAGKFKPNRLRGLFPRRNRNPFLQGHDSIFHYL